MPTKATDTRKANFEERYGEGGVELDALAAIRPGELRRMVSTAIDAYRDDGLTERLHEAVDEATETVEREWGEVSEPLLAELRTLREEATNATEPLRQRDQALIADLDAAMAPFRERLEEIDAKIEKAADEFDPDLPERPEAVEPDVTERDVLLDSRCPWLEQHERYRSEKQRP